MDEELFRRIASEYVNQSGSELRRELDELEQSGVTQVAPSLDRRVFARIRAIKRARNSKTAGLIAACLALALALLFPAVWLWRDEPSTTPPGSMASPSPSSPTGTASHAPAEYAVIPLSAELPERFSVSAVEQDIEKTIYYIEDAELDNIVMTLQHSDDLTMLRELSPVTIGAYTAYGRVESGYRLLAFEKEDVLYILTCEHDINTLVELGKSILI